MGSDDSNGGDGDGDMDRLNSKFVGDQEPVNP